MRGGAQAVDARDASIFAFRIYASALDKERSTLGVTLVFGSLVAFFPFSQAAPDFFFSVSSWLMSLMLQYASLLCSSSLDRLGLQNDVGHCQDVKIKDDHGYERLTVKAGSSKFALDSLVRLT